MSASLRNADSGKVEYYTPSPIVEAARLTLGEIDLDPFSNAKANSIIKARFFFSLPSNGFNHNWFGRVWMNPPFGKFTSQAVHKLLLEYISGEIESACCITHANTSEKWFQLLAQYPQCFLSPRTNYIDGETMKPTNGATKGSVVTYMGENLDKFKMHFRPLGTVKV